MGAKFLEVKKVLAYTLLLLPYCGSLQYSLQYCITFQLERNFFYFSKHLKKFFAFSMLQEFCSSLSGKSDCPSILDSLISCLLKAVVTSIGTLIQSLFLLSLINKTCYMMLQLGLLWEESKMEDIKATKFDVTIISHIP